MGELKWYGKQLVDTINNNFDEAMLEALQPLAAAAAAKAQRGRTGRLAQSIYIKTATYSTYKKRKGHRREVSVPRGSAAVAAAMFYGKFVELGTTKMSARPFLRPAFDEQKNQVMERTCRILRDRLQSTHPAGGRVTKFPITKPMGGLLPSLPKLPGVASLFPPLRIVSQVLRVLR